MQTNPETGHAVIGNRQLRAAVFQDTVKERNDGASAACHVAVTDNGEADILCARISIGCNKQFIGNKLGAAVQVDRVYRLVRGKRYHLFTFMSRQASITFCAPLILVLIASAGLYSHAGTCFKAAACTT